MLERCQKAALMEKIYAGLQVGGYRFDIQLFSHLKAGYMK